MRVRIHREKIGSRYWWVMMHWPFCDLEVKGVYCLTWASARDEYLRHVKWHRERLGL